MIGTISVQIPWPDIEGTAQYAYNWPDALEELKTHDSHAIVSVSSSKAAKERFGLLTKVLYSILATPEAVGVYDGTQSLLIPRGQYLSESSLKSGSVPINLWVYIGLRQADGRNAAYTYGLSSFGKSEIEILDSNRELSDLYNMLANVSEYVISNDIIFKAGQTFGYSEQQKLKIRYSKGVYVSGSSFKLEYN